MQPDGGSELAPNHPWLLDPNQATGSEQPLSHQLLPAIVPTCGGSDQLPCRHRYDELRGSLWSLLLNDFSELQFSAERDKKNNEEVGGNKHWGISRDAKLVLVLSAWAEHVG